MVAFAGQELARWCRGVWTSAPSQPVVGLSIDSRTLRPGELYLALRGDRFDGHDFALEAVAAGAAGVVAAADAAGLEGLAGPVLRVADTKQALHDMAEGHRGTLEGTLVGITGSVGKTTVKEMLACMLAMAGPTAKTHGNWNNDIGLPLSLLDMASGDAFGVFEVGMNHPGELAPLCRLLGPRWGVVTPVGMAHKAFFDSVEAIAEEKATLVKSLPPDGGCVLNRDRAWFSELTAGAQCPVTTVSLRGGADYVARPGAGSCEITETETGTTVEFKLSFSGSFMIENALFAVALARRLGVSWDLLQAGLGDFTPSGMRWERVEVEGVTVVNDAYNANPVSMRAALDAFAELDLPGRRWLVLAGMFELGDVERAEHLALGRVVAQGDWAGLVVVGERGRLIARGAQDAGMRDADMVWCKDAADAADAVRAKTRPGDGVLLKASRGEHLDEVLKALTAET